MERQDMITELVAEMVSKLHGSLAALGDLELLTRWQAMQLVKAQNEIDRLERKLEAGKDKGQ